MISRVGRERGKGTDTHTQTGWDGGGWTVWVRVREGEWWWGLAAEDRSTSRPEINSNNFGRSWTSSADSNSNFVVVETISKKNNSIFCLFGVH